METPLFEKKFKNRFFIAMCKTDDVWYDQPPNGPRTDRKLWLHWDNDEHGWSIGLVTGKIYSLFGRVKS